MPWTEQLFDNEDYSHYKPVYKLMDIYQAKLLLPPVMVIVGFTHTNFIYRPPKDWMEGGLKNPLIRRIIFHRKYYKTDELSMRRYKACRFCGFHTVVHYRCVRCEHSFLQEEIGDVYESAQTS